MFDYVVNVLSCEIEREARFNGILSPKINEIKKAIQILRDGQGYLTKEPPKKIIMYDEL